MRSYLLGREREQHLAQSNDRGLTVRACGGCSEGAPRRAEIDGHPAAEIGHLAEHLPAGLGAPTRRASGQSLRISSSALLRR
jgi:hypothetical protein